MKATVEVYRPLVDSVPDALVLVSAGGTIMLANAQAEALFGYGSGELAGLAVDRLVPPRFRDRHPEHRKSFFGDPKVRAMGTRGQLHGLRKDESEFAIEINLAPVQTDIGLLVSAAIRDVTEQRRLQEQLERKNEELEEQYRRGQEANRLKSEFLANMSHELRTPLNAIIGFSEILHDGKVGDLQPQQKEFTGDVLASARHLLQLINDVLDLAKVEAGKIEFRPEPVDLARLVSEVRDVVRTLVARKRLRVSTEIDPSLTDLVLDPGKLKQVLYNYLSNAIKFSNDGGEVTVRALPKGAHHLRLEVSDTGIGIRHEDLGRLFVEFQQLDTSSAKKYQGTGLGLALTKRVVVAQGGSVGVSSEFGKGSTFHAILPRQSGASAAESRTPRALGEAGAPAVLVVEDDPRDLEQISGALIAGGYSVHTATNGQHAVALCREHAYAGITLDLLLPDMNGWEVLRAIRAAGANMATPVVVVTVVADRGAAAAYAVQDYLVKPVDVDQVLKSLRQCGVGPAQHVLIVDSDRQAAKTLQERLERAGYRTLHAATGAEAQDLLKTAKPDAAVVDVTAQNGELEILARIHGADVGHHMPVILSSRESPGPRLRRPLGGVNKGHGAGEAVVTELRRLAGK